MRLLLLHLSDLHLTSEEDALLPQYKAITSAVRNIDPELSHVVVAVTGDIAFDGSEEAYVLAAEFFSSLSEDLGAAFELPVDIISIPGNHDCDFSSPQDVRNVLLNNAFGTGDEVPSEELLDKCLEVQGAYREFADSVHTLNPSLASSQLLQEYRLAVNGSDEVSILGLNTAWMSKLHEDQGSLLFPPAAISERLETAVCIALMHHPYPWLEASNLRAVRARLERIADVILTGHEHDVDRRQLETALAHSVTYIEGGALQQSGQLMGGTFNAVIDRPYGAKAGSP